MKGLLYILCAYLIGELLSILTFGHVPGSVLGMLILFAALSTGIVKAGAVKATADFILRHMLLFFIPVCAGIVVSYKLLGSNALSIAFILIFTTLIVIGVVGKIYQKKK